MKTPSTHLRHSLDSLIVITLFKEFISSKLESVSFVTSSAQTDLKLLGAWPFVALLLLDSVTRGQELRHIRGQIDKGFKYDS